jgi:hypothetical protein
MYRTGVILVIEVDSNGDLEIAIVNSKLISCRVDWKNGCHFMDWSLDFSFYVRNIEITKGIEGCILDLTRPENWLTALSFLGQFVSGCIVHSSGVAEIRFANGDLLKLLSEDLYDNWAIMKRKAPTYKIIGTIGNKYALYKY